MATLTDSIYTSLSEFARFLREADWRGREREAVSLYAFGFLQRHLGDPRRICIEGAVPAPVEANTTSRVRKAQVCKDLVIWPAAAMTAWDKDWNVTNIPTAVLEWKLFRRAGEAPAFSSYDRDWLCEFTRQNPGSEGYSVTVDLLQRRFLLHCRRFSGGEESPPVTDAMM